MNKTTQHQTANKSAVMNLLGAIWRKRFIYCLLLPATVLVIIFSYLPLGGLKMAFQDYNVYNPSASTFIGLENFKEIFRMKGGTGKTTTTVNLGIGLANEGKKVLLIDCTPSLGMLTVNALTVANEVIIPVQSHFLPAKGLEQLLGTIAKVKRQINPQLKINGILLTMVDSRTNFARDISQLIRNTSY